MNAPPYPNSGPSYPGQSVVQVQGGAPPQSYPSSNPGFQGQVGGQVTEKAPWNPAQATAYSGPDIGNEDLDENHQPQEETASAPSYELVVSGYENVNGLSDAPVGPPPSYEEAQNIEAALVDTANLPAIRDDEARDALLSLVAEKTCWGSGAAKNMAIKDMIPTCAYHYTLETYTEGRSTKYTHVPFKGGIIDGPGNGPAPMPWDIPCNCTALFKTEVHKIPVPHTDVVKTCHKCFGRGFNRCNQCWGRGNVRCSSCHGSGHRTTHDADGRSRRTSCGMCHGRGRRRCYKCHGSGCVVCFVCEGYGSIKQFIQLTVSFTDRVSDHIVERTDLPDELIRSVQGTTIFQQTQSRVKPIQNFFEPEINQKSSDFVQMHSQSWQTDRVLQQRHVLRSVPVHECHFSHGGKQGRFWVYGQQRKVYTKDYPHTCCCCRCVIL